MPSTNVEEANVQSADALNPAIGFTRPGTQTTNEMSVPVQQEAGLGTRTTTVMGVPAGQAIGSSSQGLGTQTTTELGVPAHQATGSSSPGLDTRTTTEMGVSVCRVRECSPTAKGESTPEFLQATGSKAVLNRQGKNMAKQEFDKKFYQAPGPREVEKMLRVKTKTLQLMLGSWG